MQSIDIFSVVRLNCLFNKQLSCIGPGNDHLPFKNYSFDNWSPSIYLVITASADILSIYCSKPSNLKRLAKFRQAASLAFDIFHMINVDTIFIDQTTLFEMAKDISW